MQPSLEFEIACNKIRDACEYLKSHTDRHLEDWTEQHVNALCDTAFFRLGGKVYFAESYFPTKKVIERVQYHNRTIKIFPFPVVR